MLAFDEAKKIAEYVNDRIFNGEQVITIEDAANMQPIPGRKMGSSYTILATQFGDYVFLVTVQYGTEKGFIVKSAHVYHA